MRRGNEPGRVWFRFLTSRNSARLGERINTNTIAIVSGNINAAWLTIAYDLSAVLDNGDDFRVLPVIGRGGEQNVRDVRYLKGVDLGITVTPVLTTFRRTGELGNIDDKIVYITKLFNQEMHVLVRANSGITSLEQLRGKTVNFSDAGSATQQSAREVFKRLNIEVKEVNIGQADAYEAMKRNEMAGTLLSNAMPAPAIARLRPADGFRLIPVTYSTAIPRGLLPGDDLARGLSEPDPQGPEHRHHRLRFDDRRLQLAEGHRPASAHRAVRRSVLHEVQRIPETAASSQMAGGQSRRAGSGLEAVSMPPRNGSQEIARNSSRRRLAAGFRPLPRGQARARPTRPDDGCGSRAPVPGIRQVEPGQEPSLKGA